MHKMPVYYVRANQLGQTASGSRLLDDLLKSGSM